MCLNHQVPVFAGLPQGSGVGTPAAAKLLEEAALLQGGEGSSPDSTDAGEGHSTSDHRIQQVINKK